MLWALARFAEGTERFPYNEVEGPLVDLLDGFGRPNPNNRPFSFWRLPSDGVWEIEGDGEVGRTSAGDMRLREAREHNPVGRFPGSVERLLRREPGLVGEIASNLLRSHFPDSIHDDILTVIGLDLEALDTFASRRERRRRDPNFRSNVIRAYGHCCAICGFETRVGSRLVGVDAAHVRWHQAGGADVDDVTNGVALCALHHRLLDSGAFTLSPASSRETVVEVAEDAHGGRGFEAWLLAFHGRPIAEPVRADYRIAEPSMAWHRTEVFKGPARV